MSTKQILICDKCGHEAPDPNPGGVPMPVTMAFVTQLPENPLETWWRLMSVSYGLGITL